jgi:hypothetical protein
VKSKEICKTWDGNADDAKATEATQFPMSASFRPMRMKSKDLHYVFTTTNISAKMILTEFASLELEANEMTLQKQVSMGLDSTLSII